MDDFKPIELGDIAVFKEFLAVDPPRTSELTFTNLFMWRNRYRPAWRAWQDFLLLMLRPDDEAPFGLPPVGKGDKREAIEVLCKDLAKLSSEVKICRAEAEFVRTYVERDKFHSIEDPNNSDYVYLTENLIHLPGNRYHRKKNHLNKFLKTYAFEYRELDADLVTHFLGLQEAWCELRDCAINPGLFQENIAIYEALTNYEVLGFTGGAILIDSKVEAFCFGEPLNPETGVIHIEKANPDIHGLYAAINQRFCMEAFPQLKYINREQDLGLEGLRQAKLSYLPDHMVEKFTLIRK